MRKKCKVMTMIIIFLFTISSLSMTTLAISEGTKDVGGGTWEYGSYYSLNGEKNVYSSYWHPHNTHSASVRLGRMFKRVCAKPGQEAYAKLTGPEGKTRAYWDNEAENKGSCDVFIIK